MRIKNKNTLLFVVFLLIGGFLHSLDGDLLSIDDVRDHFAVTIMYCAEYLIYACLILSWMQSINSRLLPTRSKRYLLAAAGLMLLFLAAQFTKFRIAVGPGVTRYCWYIYYIPILLIPTLFLMTCFRLFRETDSGKPSELLFLLPAGVLVLGILSNDLHRMAFVPKDTIENMTGASNTYTHGFLYYAAYIWAGCAMAAGIVFLLIACRESGRWKKAVLPLAALVLIPVLLTIRGMIPKDSVLDAYEWHEIVIFGMLAVFEACIRNRLIPSNEDYPGIFSRIDLPVEITDKDLRSVYQTEAPVRATEDQLRASLDAPVSLTPDIRLSGMAVRAGYAFWTEDDSAVNRLNEELRDANEVLALENEILERERELASEKAGIDERIRLYHKAAQEVYPTQKKISGILEKTMAGTLSFRSEIEKVLVLTAYVKRKANFVLVEAERDTVSSEELASALEESAHYLCCCGINAVTDIKAQRAFPCREAMAVYDFFEMTAESLLGKTKELFIRLQDHELIMMADMEELGKGGELPDLTGVSLPVRQSFEDGQLIVRAELGGETA